jgi:hypothetical protein
MGWMKVDAIVIGAGAAGLFCAMTAGGRGRKILLLEHNAEVGRKIVISGGGRCNFTNLNTSPNNFISKNPHFCKSALARYTPQDFVSLVKKHRIPFYEKKLGQLFCRKSSRQIVQMLLDECREGKVRIRVKCTVKDISKNGEFTVETNQGVFQSGSLVMATGGLSFPKIGASDFGYKIARQFGLKIVETRPALVPLEFDKSVPDEFKKLAGVSLEASANFGGASFRENILFTHKGLSGPAILQISSYWKPKEQISLDLLPETPFENFLLENRHRKQLLTNFLNQFLPNRFAEMFCGSYFAEKSLNQLSNREIAQIAQKIHDWKVGFGETAGYHKAEVTLGGVSTAELSSNTMEAKKVKGLYFIGEVVDVTGWLGGYNFQWAWASGFACGQVI